MMCLQAIASVFIAFTQLHAYYWHELFACTLLISSSSECIAAMNARKKPAHKLNTNDER